MKKVIKKILFYIDVVISVDMNKMIENKYLTQEEADEILKQKV